MWKLRICERRTRCKCGLIGTACFETVCYYERDPLKTHSLLGGLRSCRMCSQQVFALPRRCRRPAENAWWSLEWSPREKEPPAVEDRWGKLPSRISSPPLLPSFAPAPSTGNQHSSTPFYPVAWSPHYVTTTAVDRVGSCSIDAPSNADKLSRINIARKWKHQ